MAASLAIRLSGGSANANPLLSIGGVMSSVAVTADQLFDTTDADEALAGDVEYRKVFVVNDGTENFDEVRIWVEAQPAAVGALALALDGGGLNNDGDAAADEDTAPTGETFSAPANYAAGLSLGAMAVGDRYAVWVRRTIGAASSGTSAAANAAALGLRGVYVPV